MVLKPLFVRCLRLYPLLILDASTSQTAQTSTSNYTPQRRKLPYACIIELYLVS
jgi:hypothetical protein